MTRLSPPSDIWQCGIIHVPIDVAASTPTENWLQFGITWLPEQATFCFLADPFGLWHNGALTVFVEAYDYRTKRGRIEYYIYNSDFTLMTSGIALTEPFHLSYPQIIQHGGDIYMLPEANASGKLTLYKANNFPHTWQPCATLLDAPAIDAAVFEHDGLWHLFYNLPDAPLSKIYHATSKTLTDNFVTKSKQSLLQLEKSARMGGTPFEMNGVWHLPIQNSISTYGSSLTTTKLEGLNSDSPILTPINTLASGNWSAPFTDGLHTLSAAGDVTLFDVKRIHRSPTRHLINMQRRLRRFKKCE